MSESPSVVVSARDVNFGSSSQDEERRERVLVPATLSLVAGTSPEPAIESEPHDLTSPTLLYHAHDLPPAPV
jgi:hypothetical protein